MYRTPTNPLFLHIDLAKDLMGHTLLRRRFNMRLRDLMVRGGMIRAKGTKSKANRGWLRTPLGGQHGSNFYLWWTRSELPAFGGKKGGGDFERSIWVRAVRHHDDHSPLAFGSVDSYYPYEQPDVIDDDLFSEQPWTEGQRDLLVSRHDVKVVYGHPGSGKTSVLLKVIEESHNEKVLFSTLSRELTSVASEYVGVMAPVSTEVLAYDYLSLLGILSGRDVSRVPVAAAVDRFREALGSAGLRHDQYGPWRGNEDALYAEIRSTLLGRSVPGEPDSYVMRNGLSRLKGDAYRSLRGDSRGVGEAAASCALQVMWALESRADLAALFPEFSAAVAALRRLGKRGLPRRFEGIGKIVVDEVQDLTLLEARVVVDVARVLRSAGGLRAMVLLAGDEGQTVRASGFSWSWMNSLLYSRLVKPVEFELPVKLRTPRRISRVIENSLALYKQLERGERPGNQRREMLEDETDGQVCYVEVGSRGDAIAVLGTLADTGVCKVVVAGNEVPEWIPARLRNFVLTPLMVKGLEYSSICVLDPGAVLEKVAQASERKSDERLTGHRNRMIIDNLRVGLSRATDSLVFLDVAPTDRMRRLSKELLGEAAVSLSASELMADVLFEEVTPRERIEARLRDASGLVDVEPAQAWHRAVQAQLLHNKGDTDLGEQVNEMVVRIAARLLVDGCPEGVEVTDVIDRASRAIAAFGDSGEEGIFSELTLWTADRDRSPVPLLRLVQRHGNAAGWLRVALAPVQQTLLERVRTGAADLKEAEWFSEPVEDWLGMLNYSGDVAEETARLRVVAFNTLYDATRSIAARRVLETVSGGVVRELAGKVEALGDMDKAIFLYEYLGLHDESERVVSIVVNDLHGSMFRCIERRDYVAALEMGNKALALAPCHVGSLHGRGLALVMLNDCVGGLKDLNSAISMMRDGPAKSDMLVVKGKALSGIVGRDDEEAGCYREAIEMTLGHVAAYKSLAKCEEERGQMGRAIAVWKELMEVQPDEIEEACVRISDMHLELEEEEKAYAVLSKGIEKRPESKSLRLERVEVSEYLELDREIIKDLEYLVELYPDDVDMMLRLAAEYSINERLDDAVEMSERAVGIAPGNYRVYEGFAGVYETFYDQRERNVERKPYLTKAIRQVNKALEIRGDVRDETQAQLYYARARAYRKRGYSGDKAKATENAELVKACDAAYGRRVSIDGHHWL